MADFEVAGKKYKSKKLDAFVQLHIARRLGGIYGSLGTAYKLFLQSRTTDNPKGDPLVVLDPVGKSLKNMSDEDAEYVINSCLSVCQRFQPSAVGSTNGMWANVRSTGGSQFDDIGLPEMIQICWYVLQ